MIAGMPGTTIGDAMGVVAAIARVDAIEFLKSLDAGSVDCIVTDPAYESLEKHRARGTTTRLKVSDGSSNQWFDIFPNDRFPEFFAECYRVLKKNAHLYVYCDSETMFHVKPIGEAVGFKFWKPLIWDKVRIGMGYHYRARCEFILFFEKGKRRLNDLGMPDVLELQSDCPESFVIPEKRVIKGYPTEKPAEVSRKLILQSTQVGDLVLDPFFGSGSVGVAAILEGRRFIGCDTSEAAHRVAAERLQAAVEAVRITDAEAAK